MRIMPVRWFVCVLCWSAMLIPGLQARSTHLIIDDALLKAMGHEIPAEFHVVAKSRLDPGLLVSSLAGGDSCVWIGDPAGLPPDLWIGAFRPAQTAVQISTAASSPASIGQVSFQKSLVSSVYIKPAVEMPYHNVDEELRANLEPILEARDRFGRVVGYPGALMRYYAPTLVRKRFSGSECFVFLFDKPAVALSADGWAGILNTIAIRMRGAVQLTRVTSDYALYRIGERARITARLRNVATVALATEVRFFAKGPGETQFRLVDQRRRIPDGESESEAVIDVLLSAKPGLWTLRVELCQDLDQARNLAIEGHPTPLDRMEIGFVVTRGPLNTPPILSVDGPNLRIENQSGFWAGTNYYPSSSWWEWLWRDFRPLEADGDFASMRRTGYRIVRIWVDPILDEQALRAMDAALYLAASHGIVLDVCVFTQWVRTLGFERAGAGHVRFDFRDPRDFNVYGISFRNLNLQREYVSVLARRWRDAGNLIYNLSNETYIKDPDATQMDPEAARWKGIPAENGDLRNSLLFQRWSDEMTRAIREAGATQPVMPGYVFSQMGGGDAYLADRHGAIAAWHSYSNPANIAASLTYVNPSCSGRPLLLEEFGTRGWNQADSYDGAAHAALGSGAAGAMSYEWGVRWLAPEQSFGAAPLREILDGTPDPRWFGPVLDIAKKWPKEVPGLNFAPSGFFYGSTYSGTPFPADAAVALGRLGLMGAHLAPVLGNESAYVIVPSAASAKTTGEVIHAIEQLHREKARFGVLHEDCIQTRLPKSARVLIVPAELSRSSTQRLEFLSRSGVRILKGEQAWKASRDLPRVVIEPLAGTNESIDVLVRRTERGTLYTFMTSGAPGPVRLALTHGSVTFGLDKYGVVGESASGVSLIEAAGEVKVGTETVFRVQSGRVIVSSDDGQPLDVCRRVRMVATEPTEIRFARRIRSAAVLEAGAAKPIARIPEAEGQTVLTIDSELARYATQVDFQPK